MASRRKTGKTGERKMNPNSLKALEATKWKPGACPNPTGINQDPEIRKLKKLTTDEVKEVGSLVLSNNISELQKISDDALENPDSENSSLKVWIARVVLVGSKKGDAYALDVILNRLIGKVADKMDVTGVNAPQVIVSLPDNGRTAPTELPPKVEIETPPLESTECPSK